MHHKKVDHDKNADILNLNPKLDSYPFESKVLNYSPETQKLLLTSHNKQTHLFDIFKKDFSKCRINSKAVSCAYHNQLNLWFILTEEFQLVVMNSHSQIIAVLAHLHQLQQSTALHWITQKQYFIVVTTEHVFKMKVIIDTNVNSIKYLSSLVFDFKVSSIDNITIGLDWNNKSKMEKKFKKQSNSTIMKSVQYLYCWNSTEACIYQIEGENCTPRILRKLARRQNHITDITFSPLYNLLCMGNHIGHIKIYHLEEQKKKLLHEFEGHQKEVLELRIHRQEYLISGGLDHLIKIFNLKIFEEILVIKFGTLIKSFNFLEDSIVFCNREDGKSSFIANYSEILQNVEHILNHQSNGIELLCDQNWIIASLGNQTGVAIDQKRHQNQFHILTPANLGRFFSNGSQYYMHSQQGISQVNISPESKQNYQLKKIINSEKETLKKNKIYSKVLKNNNYSVIQDWKGIGYPITITTCWVGNVVVYPWDNDVKGNNLSPAIKQLYFMFGTDKGIIFLLKSTEIKFTAKVSLHAHPIVRLGCLNESNGITFFASLCKNNQLLIWNMLELEPPHIIYSINLPFRFNFLRILTPYIVLAQKSGNLFFYKSLISENNNLQVMSLQDKYNLDGHDSNILSIDFLNPQRPFFVSASTDNNIKVWTTNKILIYTIKFFNELECVAWLNKKNADLVICHESKISILKNKKIQEKFERLMKHNPISEIPELHISIEDHLRESKISKKASFVLPAIKIDQNQKKSLEGSRYHQSPNNSSPPASPRISNKQKNSLFVGIKLQETKYNNSSVQSNHDDIGDKTTSNINLPKINSLFRDYIKQQHEKEKNRYKISTSRQESTKTKVLLKNIIGDYKPIINLSMESRRI